MRLWELEGGDGEGAANHWAGVGGEGLAWDEDLSSDEEEAIPLAVPEAPEPAAVPPAIVHTEDDDTSDEEPAPDARRWRRAVEFAIEFVNPDGGGRRINIPDRERAGNDVPPAAPEPPRDNRRGRGQQANRQRRMQNEPPHNHRQANQAELAVVEEVMQERLVVHDAEVDAPVAQVDAPEADAADEVAEGPAAPLPRAAPGQNNNDVTGPAPARAMGLERFLELARLDAEDEWDSDELEEDDEGEWDFANNAGAAVDANAPVREGRLHRNAAGAEGRVARRERRDHWNRRGV